MCWKKQCNIHTTLFKFKTLHFIGNVSTQWAYFLGQMSEDFPPHWQSTASSKICQYVQLIHWLHYLNAISKLMTPLLAGLGCHSHDCVVHCYLTLFHSRPDNCPCNEMSSLDFFNLSFHEAISCWPLFLNKNLATVSDKKRQFHQWCCWEILCAIPTSLFLSVSFSCYGC
jgi:hypothetical protein